MPPLACELNRFLLTSSNHPRWNKSRYCQNHRSLDHRWLYHIFLLMSCLPLFAESATFRIGIVGPWNCDPIFSKALPGVAAKLAIDRINKDASLNRGYWFDFVLLTEECHTARALSTFIGFEGQAAGFIGPLNPGICTAVGLLGSQWNKPIFSWGCLNPAMDVSGFPTFARPLPFPTSILFCVLRNFRWAHVAIVTSDQDFWVETGQELANSLRSFGLPVNILTHMEADGRGAEAALKLIQRSHNVRVVVMCMHSVLIGGEEQKILLEKAEEMEMTDGSFVFMPYDTLHYSLPYKGISYSILTNNTKLQKAYDAVLTVTVESEGKTFNDAFKEAQSSYEFRGQWDSSQVYPLFGTIYNAIYYLAKAVESSRREARWASGTNIVHYTKDLEIQGFNQKLWSDEQGELLTSYVVLDTDGRGNEMQATHVINTATGSLKPTGSGVHFPHGNTPGTDANCWFDPKTVCAGGVDPLFVLLLFILISGFIMSAVGLALFLRRRILQIQLVRGPNKLILTTEDLVFINAHLSKKKLIDERISTSGRSLSDLKSTKTPYHSVSGKSLTTATAETSNVAVFEGDWVWLKKLPGAKHHEIRQSTKNIFCKLRDMRHENVNLFLGLFHDYGVLAVVTEHCSRGSLEDLIHNEDIKLDWMFKSSLLLDLIKGMKYLHHRELIHGRLKSRNCVVDGRFVLKVTDHGYSELLEAQKVPRSEFRNEELLWTAPEILRDMTMERKGTFRADVYSFSIIMQEVIVRGTPFCMLELPAVEIIKKVRKPPPLCRPSVSVDQAPMECIQLMKQCWSELPERRPTFDYIFDQFKNINKGKKTNIIDSMLRMLEQYSSNLEDLIRERTEELEIEKQKTDKLLTQMLPPSVAEALKTGAPVEPEYFDQVTLYFSDIVGFTTISAMSEPIEVVDLLNDLYTLFDAIIGSHDVYKVETIGDAYMVASGLPKHNGNRHAAEIANMSLDILSSVGSFKMRHMSEVAVKIRIGLHSGQTQINNGLTRFSTFNPPLNPLLKLFEDLVERDIRDFCLNKSHIPSGNFRQELSQLGKGVEDTYWLIGKEGFNKPLPTPPDILTGASNHGISLSEIPEERRRKLEKAQDIVENQKKKKK
ncbi:retinal guanylyl cyclase 1 [Protopterus annectens]|uniref:retinal guanylyl cyclase 1 n=1 Tax=Protopterus annectens TaxID=7888 RepID=UPI001CF97AF4|nr:retinal guanylyl cyclase 1 [Protopterus annectens]